MLSVHKSFELNYKSLELNVVTCSSEVGASVVEIGPRVHKSMCPHLINGYYWTIRV